MDDRDVEIINLRNDTAKWKGRCVEVAYMACRFCKMLAGPPEMCQKCRVREIMKEIEK